MKRFLTLRKRVSAEKRPFHASQQGDYTKAMKERKLEKVQPKLLWG